MTQTVGVKKTWRGPLAEARVRDGAACAQASDVGFARSKRGESRNDTWASAPGSKPDPKTEPALSHARIYPPGARLPASLRNMPWRQMDALDIHCLRRPVR